LTLTGDYTNHWKRVFRRDEVVGEMAILRQLRDQLILPQEFDIPASLFQDSNLRNLSATTLASAQFTAQQLLWAPMLTRAASMITIMLVGTAIFLAALAITVKARSVKPQKPAKWEKAQIVQQLLALSELEDMMNGVSRQRSVSQSPTPRRRAAAPSTSPSGTVR
jgi:hypothetical protein